MAATTVLAVSSLVASVGAAAMTTVTNVQNQDAAEKQAKANEKLANNEATAARIEQAQNANAYRSQARAQTATAEASMGAAGNVGGSSEALSRASLLNLGKDLSALKYNYDSKAVSALNAAENYRVNAKVARMNSTSALIGGSLNTVAAGANSLTNSYGAGLIGKKPKAGGGSK
jgi:hypothetical protein